MAGSLNEYLELRLTSVNGIGGVTAKRISSFFGTINDFKIADINSFHNISFIINGNVRRITITDEQYRGIRSIQSSIENDVSLSYLYTEYYVTEFIQNVIKNINGITLSSLNCNPFLASSLNLSNDVNKFFWFNVLAYSQRSIVTSFGTTVEKLLLYSSGNVEKGVSTDDGEKWDLLKKINGVNNWIEIKSGPNDMDKTQILRYKNKMNRIENRGEIGLFGITYGHLNSNSVTLGLLNTYLPNWEEKVKIGRELWGFLADEEDYAENILILINNISNGVLGSNDIIDLINAKTNEIIEEFNNSYESMDEFLKTLY